MRRTCTIRLLTAHRDQSSSSISGWFPGSGVVLADHRDTFPGYCPVVSRCDLNSTTVAGAAPDSDRLPNSPLRRHEAAPEMRSSNHVSDRDIGMKATSSPCGATRATNAAADDRGADGVVFGADRGHRKSPRIRLPTKEKTVNSIEK